MSKPELPGIAPEAELTIVDLDIMLSIVRDKESGKGRYKRVPKLLPQFSSCGPTVPKDTVGEDITAPISAVYIERTKGTAPIKGSE